MLSGLDVRNQPPRSFTVLERSIDRAGRRRGRKFKPLVLGEIQAAGDNIQRVEDKLNSRPRKILGYRTPREVFFNAKNLPVALRC
jgi:hypothetical protein